MHHRWLRPLALALTLLGCKVGAPAPAVPRASAKPAPSQGVVAVPSAPAGKPQGLQKPATPSVTLAGKVAMDASYVVGAGTGTVVAGQLISDAGSAVLANNGGSLLSNNGGNLISDNGGGIIANNGAGLTSKTKRTLLAAPAYGTVLPAGGMTLGVRSLKTGKAVPVGADGAGNPVYGIYTKGDGSYEVYLPEEEAGNVLVEVQVPSTTDPRQRYQLIARPAAGRSEDVDEDTAQLTRYMRAAFVAQIYNFMTQPPAQTICSIAATPSFPQAFKTVLTGTLPEVYDAAQAAGIDGSDAQLAAVQALAGRCADLVIARVDLEAVTLDHTSTPDWGTKPNEGPEPAIPAAVLVMKAFRETVTKRLATEPTYFADQAYFHLANECKPTPYAIKKPSDATAFLVDEYLSDSRNDAIQWADIVIDSIGTPPDATGVAADRRLNAAAIALAQRMALAFFGDEGGAKAACLDLIRHFDPLHPLGEGVPVPPAKPRVCPHPYADGYSDGCATGAPTPIP